ncbi:MAG: hypothetical protein M3Z29_11600 [Pseudomonadota bacterium]|nr:hypothetical protein [Pseudomonadota bacterium]
MQMITLEGHYGQRIEVDVCAACHLAWFDDTESVRLSGLGWSTLLRHMHAVPAGGGALVGPFRCVRCSAALKPVSNASRFGRSSAHVCSKGHGYSQTFGQLLAERGLVRPLGARDRQILKREGRLPACLNCGGALPERASLDLCSYCRTPLLVFDLKRLLGSLMVRHGMSLPADAGRPVAWSCKACGSAVDPSRDTRCASCGHGVVAPSLSDAMPLLDILEPQLRALQPRGPRPHGERLRRHDGFRATALFRVLLGPLGWTALARRLDRDTAARTPLEPAPDGSGWPRLNSSIRLGLVVVAIVAASALVHLALRR